MYIFTRQWNFEFVPGWDKFVTCSGIELEKYTSVQ